MRRTILKITAAILLTTILCVLLFGVCITRFDDRLSTSLRNTTERAINQYLEGVSHRTASETLTGFDSALLHTGAITGVGISYFPYREASRLLYHYIHGDGEPLELSADYFRKSDYLQKVIARYGEGQHGPIALDQQSDWRLALALNPFYLDVKNRRIRIFHPNIVFAPAADRATYTIIPIGKVRLKVFDNTISALKPTPFDVHAEWTTE